MGTKRAFLQGFFIFVFGIGFFSRSFLWAEPEIDVRLSPPHKVKAGSTCLLTIQLSWRSEEGDYRFPMPELALDNLSIEDIGESNEVFRKEEEVWRKKTFRFTLRGIRPGMGRVHPSRVSYLDLHTQVGGHFEIPTREVKVLPDRSKGYGGIAGTLGLLGMAGLLGGLAFFWQSIRKQGERNPSEPTLEDRYLAQLKGAHEVFEAGKLFRAYLSEKYSIPREFITTRETIEKMESKASRDELKVLKRIFDQLDKRRYGNRPHSAEEWRTLYQEIIHYVEGKKVIVV